MKDWNNTINDSSGLSKQAEKAMQERIFNNRHPSKLSPEETSRLIYELQVHQIELEIKNEELSRTQLELQASRNKYSDLYDYAPGGYFTISIENMILEANLTGASMLGVERSGLIGIPFSNFITRDMQDVYYNFRQKLLETTVPQICEVKLTKNDGGQFHARLECVVAQDKDDNINEFRMTLLDISEYKQVHEIDDHKRSERVLRKTHDDLELKVKKYAEELVKKNENIRKEIAGRKLAEEAMLESEETYRSMVEALSDNVHICSHEFFIEYMNPAMIKRIGRNAVGEPCYKAINDLDKPCPWCVHDKVQRGETMETEIISPQDDRRYRVLHSPIYRIDGSISKMTIYKDITDEKHIQAALVRSERLAATGQLAASIAHEINSPLQAVTIMLGTIKKKYGENKELSDKIELLKGAFGSIRNTVKNLLDLNRPGTEEKQTTSVNNIIEKTVVLVQSHLKSSKIKVNLNLSSEVPTIIASPQQLNQVFLNLINNSIEAIAGKSEIKENRIARTSNGEKININTDHRKGNVIISVSDTGPGISQDDLNHVFDPFFTRKKAMGMGVGLSVCHEIIQDHNGTIVASNSPDGGVVFTITLPAL